jgi:hypothetical protein
MMKQGQEDYSINWQKMNAAKQELSRAKIQRRRKQLENLNLQHIFSLGKLKHQQPVDDEVIEVDVEADLENGEEEVDETIKKTATDKLDRLVHFEGQENHLLQFFR